MESRSISSIGLGVLLWGLLCSSVSADDCGSNYQLLHTSNSTIPNANFNASSWVDGLFPWYARGNDTDKEKGPWCPKAPSTPNPTEWLRIDFGQMIKVSAMEVKGRHGKGQGNQYSSHIRIRYMRSEDLGFKDYINDKGEKVLKANDDAHSTEVVTLGFIAKVVQIYPVTKTLASQSACLGVEFYSCRTDGLAAYTVPKGNTMTTNKGKEIRLIDWTYDGVDFGKSLQGGLGQLNDRKYGLDSAEKIDPIMNTAGYGWVGWNHTTNKEVVMIFEFDTVRNFSAIWFDVSNEMSLKAQVFQAADVYFSVGGNLYPDDPIHFVYSKDEYSSVPHKVNPMNNQRPRVGRFIKVILTFAAEWILISEVSFMSTISTGTHLEERNPSVAPPYGPPSGDPNVNDDDKDQPNTPVIGFDKQTIGIIVGVCTAFALIAVAFVIWACIRWRRKRSAKRRAAASSTSEAQYKLTHGHGYDGLPTSDKESEAVYDEPWTHVMGDTTLNGQVRHHHGQHVPYNMYPHGEPHHQSSGYISESATAQIRPPSSREYAVPELGPPSHTMMYPPSHGGHHPSAFQRPSHTMQPQHHHHGNGWSSMTPPPPTANGAHYPMPLNSTPHPHMHHHHMHDTPNGHFTGYFHQQPPSQHPAEMYPDSMPTQGVAPNISIQGASGNSVYASALEMAAGSSQSPGSLTGVASLPDYPIMEIPKQNLRTVDRLGVGQFGEVNLCEAYDINGLLPNNNNDSFQGNEEDKQAIEDDESDKSKPVLVAVKVLKLNAGSAALHDFQREMRLMGRLRDPNVVRLLGVSTVEEPACMIVEYMPHGDLHEFLNRHRAEGATEDPHLQQDQLTLSRGCLIYMASQIASGMKYLESLHMVHRDLAARNCLVGPRFSIKVSDFGMSRSLYTSDYYRIEGKVVLPIRWMAWESILLGKFTAKSDVWSFGVTLWEILTFARYQPYIGMSDEKVIENCSHFYENNGRQTYLDRPGEREGMAGVVCPKEVYDLMKECWNHDDNERPAFSEIHMFLQRKNIGYRPEQESTYALYSGSHNTSDSDATASTAVIDNGNGSSPASV